MSFCCPNRSMHNVHWRLWSMMPIMMQMALDQGVFKKCAVSCLNLRYGVIGNKSLAMTTMRTFMFQWVKIHKKGLPTDWYWTGEATKRDTWSLPKWTRTGFQRVIGLLQGSHTLSSHWDAPWQRTICISHCMHNIMATHTIIHPNNRQPSKTLHESPLLTSTRDPRPRS